MTIATKPEDLSHEASSYHVPTEKEWASIKHPIKEKVISKTYIDCNDKLIEQDKRKGCLASDVYIGPIIVANALGILNLIFISGLAFALYRSHISSHNLSSQLEEIKMNYDRDLHMYKLQFRREVSQMVQESIRRYQEREDSFSLSNLIHTFSPDGSNIDTDLNGPSAAISDDEIEIEILDNNVPSTGERPKRQLEEGEPHHDASNNRKPKHRRRHKRNRCSGCLRSGAFQVDHLQGNQSVSYETVGAYKNWEFAEWSNGRGRFDQRSGKLRIRQSGIYFVYAQILFLNGRPGPNGFDVIASHTDAWGDTNSTSILSCTHSIDYYNASRREDYNLKYKTCYTAGLAKIMANDTLHVQTRHNARKVLFNRSTSFWGTVLIPTADEQTD